MSVRNCFWTKWALFLWVMICLHVTTGIVNEWSSIWPHMPIWWSVDTKLGFEVKHHGSSVSPYYKCYFVFLFHISNHVRNRQISWMHQMFQLHVIKCTSYSPFLNSVKLPHATMLWSGITGRFCDFHESTWLWWIYWFNVSFQWQGEGSGTLSLPN